jgi:hypothetical protein
MTGGEVPTATEAAAERSSSARGFPAKRVVKLRPNSYSGRRRSYLGGRIRQRMGGGRGSTATGSHRRRVEHGDRAPAKDWRRGGVVELRCSAVKLPRWLSGTMGVSVWELRSDQGFAGEEEGGGGGVRGSGRVKSKGGSGMERERERASAALELEKERARGCARAAAAAARWRTAEPRGGVARAREG